MREISGHRYTVYETTRKWNSTNHHRQELDCVKTVECSMDTVSDLKSDKTKISETIISALIQSRSSRPMICSRTMEQKFLIAFMMRLTKIVPCKAYRFLDNLKILLGIIVTKWVERIWTRLKLILYYPILRNSFQTNTSIMYSRRTIIHAVEQKPMWSCIIRENHSYSK